MTKIMVTGSCGFIFSNFVLYGLQHTDYDFVSIDKLTYAGSLHNVPQVKRHKLYLGDICDYHFVKKVFEIEKPDIVIQGAAESHVDNSINDSSAFVRTNVLGTHSMLEAALKVHTPKKFINVSTDEVYGSVKEGSSIESDLLKPRSPYSSTKASADLLGQSYHVTHGLPVITTRCANNFGPRQHEEKFVPMIITSALKDYPITLYGDGKHTREWIYIKDHYHALISIIEHGTPGEIYNISSGFSKQNIEIIDIICEIMGPWVKDLVKYVTDRSGHDRRYSVDSSKLRSLGWEPKYSLENALAHTVGWYKSNTWFWKDKYNE